MRREAPRPEPISQIVRDTDANLRLRAGVAQEATEELQLDLDLKAPLDSPALTGTPTAPTPASSDDSTKLATTAFVHAVILDLIAMAPGALDTLDELANALGDDPNFATTVTNALATKLVKTNNLSDLTNAATARTNLGLAIGTNVQAYSANLTTWAGVAPATGVGTFLATPSSSNLLAALTTKTGTGNAVFSASPTLSGTVSVSSLTAIGTVNITNAIQAKLLLTNSGASGKQYGINSAADGNFYFSNETGAVNIFFVTSTGDLTTTGFTKATEFRVGSNKVVGARGAALPADATDLATAITLVNAIKSRIKTTGGHGLVAD